jgi:hypothetical protein
VFRVLVVYVLTSWLVAKRGSHDVSTCRFVRQATGALEQISICMG